MMMTSSSSVKKVPVSLTITNTTISTTMKSKISSQTNTTKTTIPSTISATTNKATKAVKTTTKATKATKTTTSTTTTTTLTTTVVATTLAKSGSCDRCIGCPNGDQIVQPLKITLLCQDNKAYVRVNKQKNYSKIYEGRSYIRAGLTHFTAYRIIFENSNVFMATNDFKFSESKSIKLADGKTVLNEIKAGYGGDCNLGQRKGSFSLDLTGTKLALHQSVEWKTVGWKPGMVSHFGLIRFTVFSSTMSEQIKKHQLHVVVPVDFARQKVILQVCIMIVLTRFHLS